MISVKCDEMSEDLDCMHQIDTEEFGEDQFTLDATPLRLNPSYVKYYLIYLNFLIHALLPLLSLLILNTLIYKKVLFLSIELKTSLI